MQTTSAENRFLAKWHRKHAKLLDATPFHFHRHSGVLWSHAVEHTEELRAEAGGGQPHGRAVGEECFPTKVWTSTFYLPSGGGESAGVDNKKKTLCLPRKVHACAVGAEAIQKVKLLKAEVETFFIARSSGESSMTQQTVHLLVTGGKRGVCETAQSGVYWIKTWFKLSFKMQVASRNRNMMSCFIPLKCDVMMTKIWTKTQIPL